MEFTKRVHGFGVNIIGAALVHPNRIKEVT